MDDGDEDCIQSLVGTSIPMTGLSQLSKSASFVGSPVTFNARRRILYKPFGIVVPLANVLVNPIWLKPEPSCTTMALVNGHNIMKQKVATYVLIRVSWNEVELDQRAYRFNLAERAALHCLRKRKHATLIQGGSELDVGVHQIHTQNRCSKVKAHNQTRLIVAYKREVLRAAEEVALAINESGQVNSKEHVGGVHNLCIFKRSSDTEVSNVETLRRVSDLYESREDGEDRRVDASWRCDVGGEFLRLARVHGKRLLAELHCSEVCRERYRAVSWE